jgi:O-6-methylguanine DNA methyltransferase
MSAAGFAALHPLHVFAEPDGSGSKILQVWRVAGWYDPTMTASGFTLFDTAIGRCGIAWGERGVAGVQLPEAGEADTRARMLHRFPAAGEAAPPAEARQAIERMAALLRGEASDLSTIALDMDGVPEFHRRVYEAARDIPPGNTLSYGDIARRVGAPGAARAVGQALGRNPFPIIVPCHRVLAAGGKIGGFSAQGGVTTKRRMLTIEGARLNGEAPLVDDGGTLPFDPDLAIAHLRASDPVLARTIDEIGPFLMRLRPAPSVFAVLARAIVNQQLNGKAAAAIFARLCALFPRGEPSARRMLRLPEERLRGVGLSGSKLLSLRDLAQKAADGAIPTLAEIHDLPDEAIIEQLSKVRGIGRWSAEMLLMFRLGRPDVLPVDDYGVRKGFSIAYNRELPSPKELAAYGVRWKPYRTAASWYLWRVVERATARKVIPMEPAEEVQ